MAFDSASAAAKRDKISEWAHTSEPADVEGQKAADHFKKEPEAAGMRLGPKAPPDVIKAANAHGAEAAHRAYLDATAAATNVSESGTEVMARAQYAAQRAAAKAQDEVHTAYAAGHFRPPSGEDIVGAAPIDAKIANALKTDKAADFADDIATTAPMITRHEAAHADLVDALKQDAPFMSVDKARQFRAAQQAASAKATDQVGLTADAMAKAPTAATGLLSKATDAAATYQALVQLGVPLPDPHSIPVIGPLLSAYLKAKVIGKAFGRRGGGVAATAETTIAAKSAAVRQRIYKAVDASLGVGAKVTGAAAKYGGGAIAALGHTLFDAGPPAKQPYSSAPEAGELGDLYLKRQNEVIASQKPGAIQDAITKRVRASDPDIISSIVDAQTRVLGYVASKMPQASSPPGILDGRVWLPAKSSIVTWGRIIGATQDPAGVLERAAAGEAGGDELDAVKACYPSLYADAQQRVVSQVADGKGHDLTSAQRQMVSRTWGLPLDASSQPGHAQWLQASYAAMPPAPMASQGPMSPTIAAPVNLGQRTLTHLDSST